MIQRKSTNLLLVDDDPSLLKLLGMRLMSEGFNVATAESGAKALAILSSEHIDLVISDLYMDEMDGMTLFEKIQQQQAGLPVIILTAHGSIAEAVSATQKGVFSFLTKPVDRDALYKAIDDALGYKRIMSSDIWQHHLLTHNPDMQAVLEQAKLLASDDLPLLIVGAAGVGKRTLAKIIHQTSTRKDNPLWIVDYQRLNKKGISALPLTEPIEKVTLILTGIDQLTRTVQSQLMALLMEHQHQNTPLIRLIATSYQMIDPMNAAITFDKSLVNYFMTRQLQLPNLSDRTEDITLLAEHFLRIHAARRKPLARTFEPQALKALSLANWPGNVTQLNRVVERCVHETLLPMINQNLVAQILEEEGASLLPLRESVERFEANYLQTLLRMTKGDIFQAANIAQYEETKLRELLDRYHLNNN